MNTSQWCPVDGKEDGVWGYSPSSTFFYMLEWLRTMDWKGYKPIVEYLKVLSHHFVQDTGENSNPVWFSGQSSWLQIRRPEFDSRHN
jgi:hypothetical protein